VLRTLGKTQQEIATAIGKDKSVVSRELRRNSDGRNGIYSHHLAQRKYQARQEHNHVHRRFTPAVEAYVEELLRHDYSPEQIVGTAERDGKQCVSHERIYQHIWHNKRHGGDLHTHLRTHGKRYRKRGQAKDKRGIIPRRIDIDQRPAIVEEKSRFGDFELDTIIGKNHRGALVTLNDRKTGLVKIAKVESREATTVTNAIIDTLMPIKEQLHTITADNGKEFALHEHISRALNIKFYFAKPYHAWERGANENLNGLIRQYFPKKTDFSSITDEQIRGVEEILNTRPRKRFGFVSPLTVYSQTEKVAFAT